MLYASYLVSILPMRKPYELITVKTFAKENPTTAFRCRIPAKYDKSSATKYRLLIYFGGRNTTGENEVKSNSWGTWCDRNGVFLIVPSCKNDNYWEPQKWSGKALLEAIERLKKKYSNICDDKLFFYGYSAGAQCQICFRHGFRRSRERMFRTHAVYSISRLNA